MGAILGGLFVKSGPEIDISLDAEKTPPPADADKEVYKRVAVLLEQREDVYKLIEEYKGCQDLARAAMEKACHENELRAFEGLLNAVDSIAVFFRFVNELEAVFPKFILSIAQHYTIGNGSGAESLQDTVPQALCLQLAELVDFAIQFDQVRMLRPNLSNDFSYYRRLLPKFNKHPDIRIKDSEASGMALFTAHHIPMVNGLTKACSQAAEKNGNVSLCLALLGNSCLKGIREGKWNADKALNLKAARAMAGSVVLYDHVALVTCDTDHGHKRFHAFNKKAPIKTKEIIQILKKEFSNEVALLNAIHFSSKNFNDAPTAIHNLFE